MLDLFETDRLLSEMIVRQEYRSVLEMSQNLYESSSQTSEKRVALHFKGVAYIYMGALNKARLTLESASDGYGENIGLLRDLACCYYRLEEVDLWRSTYKKMETLLGELSQRISFQSHFPSLLTLGKFLEDDGQIAEAKDCFKRCLGLTVGYVGTDKLKYTSSILPQLIRLEAQFPGQGHEQDQLGFYYKQLLSVSETVPLDVKIEIEHALILAELALVGPSISWVRTRKLVESVGIEPIDKALVYYDYLDELLAQNRRISEEIRDKARTIPPETEFEKTILQMLTAHDGASTLLVRLQGRIPWAQYLRLLIMAVAQEKDVDIGQELINKINLILSSYTVETQILWKQRLVKALKTSEAVIEFEPHLRSLAYGEKRIDLSRKKGMLLLLEELSKSKKLGIDETIRLLWNAGYSPENYHRLRMTVHRLNQILFELTRIPKVIEVSAEQVNIKPTILLQSRLEISDREAGLDL